MKWHHMNAFCSRASMTADGVLVIVCVFDRGSTHLDVDLFDYSSDSGPVADRTPVALWSGTPSAESH